MIWHDLGRGYEADLTVVEQHLGISIHPTIASRNLGLCPTDNTCSRIGRGQNRLPRSGAHANPQVADWAKSFLRCCDWCRLLGPGPHFGVALSGKPVKEVDVRQCLSTRLMRHGSSEQDSRDEGETVGHHRSLHSRLLTSSASHWRTRVARPWQSQTQKKIDGKIDGAAPPTRVG